MNLSAQTPVHQWHALAHATILGTERSERPVGDVARIEALVSQSPNDAWLRMIAALSVYVRAGAKPAISDDSFAAFDALAATTDVVCSRAAANALERIVHEDYFFLLEDWCRAAAAADRVAPPEHLPAVLDALHRRDTKSFRDVITAVLGERGRWLTQFNPQWTTRQVATERQAAWETGVPDERLRYLRQLRATDPTQARLTLESTWQEETHEDRATFLQALETNLAGEDEAFLDNALDDARKPVRTEAARLLTLLPASAFALRMTERSTSMVQCRGSARKPKLEFALPETTDAAMKRDGIEARKRGNMGVKAVLLCDIVSATPLQAWSAMSADAMSGAGWPADVWLAAAMKSDWTDALVRGWAVAAGRQHDAAWATALIQHFDPMPVKKLANWRDELASVLPAADSATLETIVRARVKKQGLSACTEWLEAIRHWSAELSKVVLASARAEFKKQSSSYNWMLRDWFNTYASARLSLDVVDDIAKGWPTDSKEWSDKLDDMVARLDQTLRLRHIIKTEFQT